MNAPTLISLRQLSIDDLWQEAETLGNIDVRSTGTGWKSEGRRTGYAVTLTGRKRNTVLEVKREHPVLACALADAINEAREMGLGEPS